MRSSKSKTIESKGTSRSPSKPSKSPKLSSEKNLIERLSSPKMINKNNSSKQLLLNPPTPKAILKHYASNV